MLYMVLKPFILDWLRSRFNDIKRISPSLCVDDRVFSYYAKLAIMRFVFVLLEFYMELDTVYQWRI